MSIQLILGPMFAGKSTELMRIARCHQLAGRPVIMVKHKLDTRHNNTNDPSLAAMSVCTTHDGQRMEAIEAEEIGQIWDQLIASCETVICIDEGQFFPDLRTTVSILTNHYCKHVIVAALSSTYKQTQFPEIATLLPLADKVQFLRANCFRCGAIDAAVFTHRRPVGQQGESIAPKELEEELKLRNCIEQSLGIWQAPIYVDPDPAQARPSLIGGADAYEVLCRKCFYGGNLKKNS